MPSLSILRRRKAWKAGVLAGAQGKSVCRLSHPKLREIWKKGRDFGEANKAAPAVQRLLQHKQGPQQKPGAPQGPSTLHRRRGASAGRDSRRFNGGFHRGWK
jgi:hypothetical protein